MPLQKYIRKILDARVYDVAIESPLETAPLLTRRLDVPVLLKREDLQPVFSFKLRGAYNKLSQLDDEAKSRGVIAASAGNHAQGLALAAQKLGIKATIVMPRTTPEIKVNSVRNKGAKVVLKGDAFDEAAAYAAELVEQKGYAYIPPYDDEDVIAGQGTVGMEILRQQTGPAHAIFIPVGGGGLIAGVAAYVKYLRPQIKIIGVEPEDAACLQLAMQRGRRDILPEVGLFADGVAVKQIGKLPWDICKDCVDEVITVSTDEICAAIKDVFEDTRSIAEPAGALAVAGLKRYAFREASKAITDPLIAIVSGANMNFDRLGYITERTEVGEEREAILAVRIPEKPGSFKKFIRQLHNRNITEFNYRYSDPSEAQIFVGVQIREGENERETLVKGLEKQGLPVLDLTDNDLAKTHIRHMVGGHAPEVLQEKVFRVEFPERPGALMKFLMSLGTRWNITLFHYRNHGAAFGRVLMAASVEDSDLPAFRAMLSEVGFRYWEETENPAYQLFMGR